WASGHALAGRPDPTNPKGNVALLSRRMQRLFQAKGYQVAPIPSHWPNTFAAELKTVFVQRYVVGGSDGNEISTDALEFDRATWKMKEYRRLLVVPGSVIVPEDIRHEYTSLTIMNYAELLLQDADMLAYLKDVAARYEFGMIYQKNRYITPRLAL